MAKNLNIKVIKAFEIKPNSKYVLVIPKYLGENSNVGIALYKLFQDAGSEFVGLMINKPNDVKILEVKHGKVTGKVKRG